MKFFSKNRSVSSVKIYRLKFAVLLFLFVAIPALAETRYYFDKWDTDGGLPQNTVGAIRQTRDGYLWLATLDGLVRFDGVKFRVFTVGNTAGFNNNRFRLLYETPDAALWIGSEEFGVMRYKDGKFRTFTETDGLPTNSPIAFATDADGSLLVTTMPGIARFDGERFHKLPVNISINTRSCEARGGGFWLFDENGLRRLRSGAIDEIRLDASPIKTGYVPICYEDKSGAVWIAGEYGQIFIVGRNGEIARLGAENGLPADASVLFIGEDRDGKFWLGTNDGLLKFENNRFQRYGAEDGLSDKNLISFYEDREGNLWFGTSLGGLNRLSHRAISVLTTDNGLAGNGVYPIYEAKDGSIWVGAGGVTRIKDNQLTSLTFEKDGVYADTTAIAEDREGRLWFGTSGGVGFWQNGKFTDYRDKFALPRGSYTVWTIHQDRDGAIWFGTSHGLVKRSADERFEIFTTAQGLPSNDIKVIHEDKEGNLWLATYGGLAKMSPSPATVLSVFTTRDGLSSDRVRSLYEDADGTLWLGTYDGGLNRFRDGKFTGYTTKNGLFSDGVFQILPDDAGYFWMSSNQGIYRVLKQELEDYAAGKIQVVTSEAFGKRDGLLNTECNGGRQPSGVRARDGRLWFPTQEGAAIVEPTAVGKNPLAPPIVIESVAVDQKTIELNENVQIQPNQTNLEIAYTGLSFVKPEQVRFRYKLEGLDENWIEAGTRRTAYYSHLPPGEYIFRVTAANNSGVWNQDAANIRFTVNPPFWRTWWFVALAVLGVFGLIYFILRQRILKLERERIAQADFSQKLIAAQERERKRIAGELHDGLGQNLLVIKNWTLLAQQRNRENGNSEILEEISGTASQTIEEVRRIAYNLRPYQIEEIGLTRAVEGMLKRLAATTEIDITWQIDDINNCFAPENEINLFRIVQECVNNIIRHSEADEAKIIIKRSETSVFVRIEDNGRGFSPESIDGKRGLGLTGIEERARMINGLAQIQSETGRGTIVQININL